MSEKDWRIGLTVKPKYRNGPLYYERGKVLEVCESGTASIEDETGVLRIQLDSGTVIMRGADDWISA